MIVGYRAYIFVQVFIQVAIAVVGHGVIYRGEVTIEAAGFGIASGERAVQYLVQAVGIGGIAVGQVVDLAIGAGAAIGVKARALQGLDVATQVVSEVFVVVVGARDHPSVRVVVKGGAAQAAEVVIAVRHDLGLATTYTRGDLADVTCFLGGGCRQARDAGEGLVVAEQPNNMLIFF